jgi:hypothetical protein
VATYAAINEVEKDKEGEGDKSQKRAKLTTSCK